MVNKYGFLTMLTYIKSVNKNPEGGVAGGQDEVGGLPRPPRVMGKDRQRLLGIFSSKPEP